jgi:hypothetical protein
MDLAQRGLFFLIRFRICESLRIFESFAGIRRFGTVRIFGTVRFLIFEHHRSTNLMHMKRLFYFAAVVSPLLFLSACSDNTTATQEDVVPKDMKAIDLTHLGQPVKINIPDSTFYPTVDTMEGPTGIQVRIGNHFDILVNAAGAEDADLAKVKELILATDAGNSTFMNGDSATLVWETKFGDLSMHHFYRVVKTSNGTYFVRDNNTPDNQFRKEDVDRMIQSAKSLRAKPAAAAPEA